MLRILRIVLFFVVIRLNSVLGLCPTGSFRYATSQFDMGMCYAVMGNVTTYDRAAESCVELSGRLVRIPNWDVLRFITSLLKSNPRWRCWIDALDARRSPNLKTFPWMLGEPNGHYDDCVSMDASGGWADQDCATSTCYICERAEYPALTAPADDSTAPGRQMREDDDVLDTGVETTTPVPPVTTTTPKPPPTTPKPPTTTPSPARPTPPTTTSTTAAVPTTTAPPQGSTPENAQPSDNSNIQSNVVIQGVGSSVVNPLPAAGTGPSSGSQGGPPAGGFAGGAGGTTTAGAAGSTNGPGGFGGAFASSFGSAFSNTGGSALPQQQGSGTNAFGSAGSFGGGFGYGGRVNLWIIINNYKTGGPGSKAPTLESQVVRQGERNMLVFP